MKDIPYLLTTLIAHTLVLELDNRRNVKVNDLIKFRHLLFEKYLEEYQKYGDCVAGEKWEGNISFAQVDDLKEIKNLLIEYPEIFYLKDDSLWIHENIDLIYLKTLLKDKFSSLYYKFNQYTELKTIRNSLGIVKIYELGDSINNQLQKIEMNLEKAYQDLDNSQHLIKPLLAQLFVILTNITTNAPILIREYINIINSDDQITTITEDYDYVAESSYTKNNEIYPIDNNLYQNSDYYENMAESFCNTIPENIEDIYQYAIFGSNNLYEDKILRTFGQLNFTYLLNDENNSDDRNIDEEFAKENDNNFAILNNNALDEEFIFWLTYVHKIKEYLANNYDENLVKVKNRLLYLLDDISKCLYIEENFENIFEQAMIKLEEIKAEYEEDIDEDEYEDDVDFDDEYEEDDSIYSDLINEAKYLIYDCFLGREYKVTEKLLFVSTYYYLTNNEQILEILAKFENHPKYSLYKDIIIGKNYDKTLKLEN